MSKMHDTEEPVVVAVRVRPLSEESEKNAVSVVQLLPHEPKVLSVAGKGYAFDHIFTDVCGQASVYEESVRSVVKKFCAGFNCAVIAYGQTGTGKTYTMGTDSKSYEEESAGIITRAMEDVLLEMSSVDSDVLIEISFLEIYNEEVYDLLTCQPTKLIVQAFSVQSLNHVKVTMCEEALRQLEFGSRNRHTRATTLNAHSSRSHAIFTIYCHQRIGEQTIQSRLDLVDLAGSEGVRHTGNRGLALNEANNINRGLLHLRNVISILSTNTKDFIPYRSSTLTTVLRDSLSRESYVTMIVCISPSNLDVVQTATTLKFAEEAKKIMSKPRLKELIDKYKASNPEAFECFANMGASMPPTPLSRNVYKVNRTSGPHVRKAFTPLTISNVTNFSSVDKQDCFKKPSLRGINDSLSNSSVSLLSDVSASTALDMTSAALSPLVKKHMKQMEERLEAKIGTILRTELQRSATSNMNLNQSSGSPMQQILDRNFMQVQTRSMLRDNLKMFVDELKTYFHSEITQPSDERAADSVTTLKQESVRCRLPFATDGTSESRADLDSSSDAECSVSRPTVLMALPYNKWSELQTPLARDATVMQKDVLKTAIRRSVRIANRQISAPMSSINCPQADLSILSTVRSWRMSKKAEGKNEDPAGCCPCAMTTVRRSGRLSMRIARHNRDKFPVLSPSRTSTVRRSTKLSARKSRSHASTTYSEHNTHKSLQRLASSQRSRRMSHKPEACGAQFDMGRRLANSGCCHTLAPSPNGVCNQMLSHLSLTALMASPPQQFNEESSMKARNRFKEKALKLLNGSLKELTNFCTVGPKTALLIYNYRSLLNNCQFKQFEDLKNIPGLPVTYYERFMKANNLF